MSRTLVPRFAAATLIAAALAAFGPAAAASAAVPAPRALVPATDAASPAALYAGVRQAGVGEEFPVAVVGAAEGTVWEIRLADGAQPVGSVTVGADGTGTALVRIPVGTAGGATEVTAVSGSDELSTTVSVAGDPAAPDGVVAADQEEAAPSLPAGLVVAGGAGVLALAGAAVAVPLVLRRRERTAA